MIHAIAIDEQTIADLSASTHLGAHTIYRSHSTVYRGPLVMVLGGKTWAIVYLTDVHKVTGAIVWTVRRFAPLLPCEVIRKGGLYLIPDASVRLSCSKESRSSSCSLWGSSAQSAHAVEQGALRSLP